MGKKTFPVVLFGSAEATDLLSVLRSRGFVALIGSAVSMWKPSELPWGDALTKSVARILAGPPVNDPHGVIEGLIASAAFEHAMEACPRTDLLGDKLASLYGREKPNPVHDALAQMVADGVIEHIITTNYDPNMEAACRRVGPAPHLEPHCVVTEAEAEAVSGFHPVIFKIHGCAVSDTRRAPGAERTMVYRLGREGELEAWKRQLLFRLGEGRTIFLCGYSGLDFEICPELQALKARVVWNCQDVSRLTSNARRVLIATGGIALVGDMRDVLGALGGSDRIGVDFAPKADLDEEIRRDLSEWDLNVWRLVLFSGIGCASEGVRLGEELMLPHVGVDAGRLYDVLHGLGRARFHQGAYRKAAARYGEAAAVASRGGHDKKSTGARLDLIEAERCAGHWWRAWRRLRDIENRLPSNESWLKAMVAFRKVFILRSCYVLARMCLLRPIAARIRQVCKGLLRSVAESAKERGAWLDLQQCEMWARRLGIPFSEIYSGPLSPLPSREGYEQLGYFVAHTMAIRDALEMGKCDVPLDRLQTRLETASQLGDLPEVWKLSWALLRKRGPDALTPGQWTVALKAWYSCEYTLLMRLFVTLRP